MSKATWIRPVYLYLMTAIGLIVLIIGLSGIVRLGLKVYIFTQADTEYYGRSKPAPLYMDRELNQVNELLTCEEVAETDQVRIQAWLTDYETWQAEDENIDYLRSSREREAANSISLILIGFP